MEQLGTLDAARLSVVQHGTHASFRRRIIDAMREIVPASGAFFCFGPDDARAYADSVRIVDGAVGRVRGRDTHGLSRAFGFDVRSVVTTTRRAYLADELYPPEERAKLPYFEATAGDGFAHTLLFFLHEGGVLFGLAGLERRASEEPFSQADLDAIESLGPFVIVGVRSQLAYDELSREAVALRAFHKTTATLFVVDREARKVVWAANRERGVEWDVDVAPNADRIVDAAESALQARAKGEALPTPPRLAAGTVAGFAKIDGDPVFGGAKCVVLRVEPQDKAAPIDGLSKREREIARLLVAGYSGVNVAAISGLSENTVRTYVRRLYHKLGVSNRADLVRKLMAPEPKSLAPSSILAPADSSLAYGDDTLD